MPTDSEVSPQWLRKYQDDYLTLDEVGESEGVTREAIRQRLKALGITPRSLEETRRLRELREIDNQADAIRANFLRTRDISETSTALGLPAAWVKRYLRANIPDYVILTRVPRTVAKRYSTEDLHESLKSAAAANGDNNLAAADYDSYVAAHTTLSDGRPRPSKQAMALRYGSWRNALEAAGLPANPHGGPAKEFTEAEAVAAVVQCWRTTGTPPTAEFYDTWQRNTLGMPSTSTVRKLTGSWNGLLARGWQVVHGFTLDQDDDNVTVPRSLLTERSASEPGFAPYYMANEVTEISLPSDFSTTRYRELERAVRSHSRLQNSVANAGLGMGLSVFSPSLGGPLFDLALERKDGSLLVVEVKSATPENLELQMRIALGQVLRYADQLRGVSENVRPVIAVELTPDDEWRSLLAQLDVGLICEEALGANLSALL
jgi:hypothetical protein